ncbi:uncharacterized protein LOC118648766 [Monomorium pharaonis]|uniref:uncharacterized protein LOC118648176 n=1 Tax=Monomorium pharaonis TaxID=307658 RepID=UPI001745EDE0|nr:uncharacterized protein LOC118648176 [Monomorium pharaonis]XP_036151076.1 uncharacterized protein LOC118648766 [Monomorium pharaonis]
MVLVAPIPGGLVRLGDGPRAVGGLRAHRTASAVRVREGEKENSVKPGEGHTVNKPNLWKMPKKKKDVTGPGVLGAPGPGAQGGIVPAPPASSSSGGHLALVGVSGASWKRLWSGDGDNVVEGVVRAALVRDARSRDWDGLVQAWDEVFLRWRADGGSDAVMVDLIARLVWDREGRAEHFKEKREALLERCRDLEEEIRGLRESHEREVRDLREALNGEVARGLREAVGQGLRSRLEGLLTRSPERVSRGTGSGHVDVVNRRVGPGRPMPGKRVSRGTDPVVWDPPPGVKVVDRCVGTDPVGCVDRSVGPDCPGGRRAVDERDPALGTSGGGGDTGQNARPCSPQPPSERGGPGSGAGRAVMCFRCLVRGHIGRDCRGPYRGNLCYRCGAPGHVARGCSGALRCPVCAGSGGVADHKLGSASCPARRSGGRPCKGSGGEAEIPREEEGRRGWGVCPPPPPAARRAGGAGSRGAWVGGTCPPPLYGRARKRADRAGHGASAGLDEGPAGPALLEVLAGIASSVAILARRVWGGEGCGVTRGRGSLALSRRVRGSGVKWPPPRP